MRAVSLLGLLLLAAIARAGSHDLEPAGCCQPPMGGTGCAEADWRDERAWASAEYLLYWIKDGPVPGPLATTSAAEDVGALGAPTTRVLYGESGLEYGAFSGGRLTFGLWLDDCRTLGFEASGFLLEQRTDGFRGASDADGNPLFAVPVFDVSQAAGLFVIHPPDGPRPGEAGLFLTEPGSFSGGLVITACSRLWGAEARAVCRLHRELWCQVEGLAGFRYLDLDESLNFDSASLGLAGAGGFNGTQFTTHDVFATRNQFFGGQLGVRCKKQHGCCTWSLSTLVALGFTNELVRRDGWTTVANSGDPSIPSGAYVGGLLALPTNIGGLQRNEFAVAPEVEARVGWRLTDWCQAFAAYNFLYLSNVARPGAQIDRSVNPTQAPAFGGFELEGLPRPLPLFNHSDFWAQGASFGMEFRY